MIEENLKDHHETEWYKSYFMGLIKVKKNQKSESFQPKNPKSHFSKNIFLQK